MPLPWLPLYPEGRTLSQPSCNGATWFLWEYKYFNYPLPEIIAELRTFLLPAARAQLPIVGTRRWGATFGYPEKHADFIQRWHDAGQIRPTAFYCCNMVRATTTACIRTSTVSTSFRYRWLFVVQSRGKILRVGEFVLTEQRPRMQSAEVDSLRQGDGVAFAVLSPPSAGKTWHV